MVSAEGGVLVAGARIGRQRLGVPADQPVGHAEVLDGVRAEVAGFFRAAGCAELPQTLDQVLADVDGVVVPTQVVQHVHPPEVRAQRGQGVAALGPQLPRLGDQPQGAVEVATLGEDLGPDIPRPRQIAYGPLRDLHCRSTQSVRRSARRG